MDMLFINLHGFTDPDQALARLTDCLLFLQKSIEKSPRKWGQAACNVGRAHAEQPAGRMKITTKNYAGAYLPDEVRLETDPFYRCQLSDAKSAYYSTE